MPIAVVEMMLAHLNAKWAPDESSAKFTKFLKTCKQALVDDREMPAYVGQVLSPSMVPHGYMLSTFSDQIVFTADIDVYSLPNDVGSVVIKFPVSVAKYSSSQLFRVFMHAGPIFEFRMQLDEKTSVPTGLIYITYFQEFSAAHTAHVVRRKILIDCD